MLNHLNHLCLNMALFFLFITNFFSCAHPADQLVGKWSATSIVQDEEPVDIDLNLVSFEFDEDGTYQFTSTLDYREAGAFQVVDDKLITKDSIQSKQEKAVLIEQLNEDTLKLKMKNPDGWMQVTLAREL